MQFFFATPLFKKWKIYIYIFKTKPYTTQNSKLKKNYTQCNCQQYSGAREIKLKDQKHIYRSTKEGVDFLDCRSSGCLLKIRRRLLDSTVCGEIENNPDEKKNPNKPKNHFTQTVKLMWLLNPTSPSVNSHGAVPTFPQAIFPNGLSQCTF